MHNNQIKFILEQISMLPSFNTLSLLDSDVLWLQNIIRNSYDTIMSYIEDAAVIINGNRDYYTQTFNCVVATSGIIERLNQYWRVEIVGKFNHSTSNEIIVRICNPTFSDDLIDVIRSHLHIVYYEGK